MARGEADGLDATAVRGEIERALGALEDGRRIRQQLTHAANGVEAAREILGAMEHRVKAHLEQIEALLTAADERRLAVPSRRARLAPPRSPSSPSPRSRLPPPRTRPRS